MNEENEKETKDQDILHTSLIRCHLLHNSLVSISFIPDRLEIDHLLLVNIMRSIFHLATLLLVLRTVDSFSPSSGVSFQRIERSFTCLHGLLSLELEKPLGIILEEVEEGGVSGVKVEELSNSGSAYTSPYRDQLVGMKVATVMDNDVTSKSIHIV